MPGVPPFRSKEGAFSLPALLLCCFLDTETQGVRWDFKRSASAGHQDPGTQAREQSRGYCPGACCLPCLYLLGLLAVPLSPGLAPMAPSPWIQAWPACQQVFSEPRSQASPGLLGRQGGLAPLPWGKRGWGGWGGVGRCWLLGKPSLKIMQRNAANTSPLRGRLWVGANDRAPQGSLPGRGNSELRLWFGQEKGSMCLGPEVGGTAGPGVAT